MILTRARDGKPITEYRDGTSISFASGIKALKKFMVTESKTSIFDEFDYMDGREQDLRINRELNQMVYQNVKKMYGYESPRQDSNDRKKFGRNKPFKKGPKRNGNFRDQRLKSKHENDTEEPGEVISLVVKKKQPSKKPYKSSYKPKHSPNSKNNQKNTNSKDETNTQGKNLSTQETKGDKEGKPDTDPNFPPLGTSAEETPNATN